MKVLITTDLYTVKTNGVVTSINNLREELEKRGHEVRIITSSDKHKSFVENGVYYIRSFPTKIYNGTVRMPATLLHKYVRELIRWKPDVIHSQCEFFSFLYAHHISKRTGAPIVHTYHTMYEDYVRYVFHSERLGKWLTRKVTKIFLEGWVNAVIVPTEKVKHKHSDNGVKCYLNVVPSGIDLEKHKTRLTSEEREGMRSSYGISEDKILLISLGRVAKEKNISEILAFYKKLMDKSDKYRLMIAGDGPYKAELEREAVELGISDKVKFTGMIAPAEVSRYYQLGDVFVSGSTSETQGLTYIEAAANKLPLLCRYDECLENVIINGENGYSYNDENEFFEHLYDITESEEKMRAYGERSAEIVLPYDKKVFAESVEGIYTQVISAAITKRSFKKRRKQKKACQ